MLAQASKREFMAFRNMQNNRMKKILKIGAVVILPLLVINCFTSEKSLPGISGAGQITGKAVGSDGTPIVGAQVSTTYKGQTLTTTTSSTGAYSFKVDEVERGQGFNVRFTKASFETANQAAVITLPNLKVDMGEVILYINGGTEVLTRKITGQIFDNFSYKPLVGANVTTTDLAGQVLVVPTDLSGKFEIKSNYLALNSSFAVSVYKDNFITRTDLVSQISAEESPIKNSPIRLYQKFGSIYGYITEDTLGTALNGVSAVVVDSNNQTRTCMSGGPYQAEPLADTDFCPDMDDNFGTTNFGAGGGGFKIKDMFLLLGNRYNVTLTKAAAGCSTRTNGTTGCYRSKTTFSDVLLTGNNAISAGTVPLMWDAWIHGSTTGGAGVTVKMYDSNLTLIQQTTTDASGNYLFDTDKILRTATYRLTFEKTGYYSRLVGVPNGTRAPGCLVAGTPTAGAVFQSDISITITLSGANNTGSVTMSPLCDPTHCVRGTVTDYWTTLPLASATVAVFDGGWRTTTTDASGQFLINGNFGHPTARTGSRTFASTDVTGTSINTADLRVGTMVTGTGIPAGTTITSILGANSFRMSNAASVTDATAMSFMYMTPVELSKTGYTGAIDVDKQRFSFAHDGAATCPGVQYDMSLAGSACDPTAFNVGPVGPPAQATPTGGTNCTGKLVLHPIGVFSSVGKFQNQIKQTYEKFLTEKAGLTVSARTGDLVLTSGAAKNANFDGFYLHFDDTPRTLPAVPEGSKWSNHVPVNPFSTKCTPTVTTNCSPRANGVITESIGTDSRILDWGIKTYIYYHFYGAASGSYTIETTGSTDTKMTLFSQSGANLGSDDDSGSGSNARIGPINLTRGWYYIKITGKDDNVFGFFDVSVTGPAQTESNYAAMLSPQVETYQTINGPATYQTNCAPGNGNLVLSWYSVTNNLLYIAAPGENGGCSATATMEKHGPIGDIIRGKFSGTLRPIAPGGVNQAVNNGYFNLIRME